MVRLRVFRVISCFVLVSLLSVLITGCSIEEEKPYYSNIPNVADLEPEVPKKENIDKGGGAKVIIEPERITYTENPLLVYSEVDYLLDGIETMTDMNNVITDERSNDLVSVNTFKGIEFKVNEKKYNSPNVISETFAKVCYDIGMSAEDISNIKNNYITGGDSDSFLMLRLSDFDLVSVNRLDSNGSQNVINDAVNKVITTVDYLVGHLTDDFEKYPNIKYYYNYDIGNAITVDDKLVVEFAIEQVKYVKDEEVREKTNEIAVNGLVPESILDEFDMYLTDIQLGFRPEKEFIDLVKVYTAKYPCLQYIIDSRISKTSVGYMVFMRDSEDNIVVGVFISPIEYREEIQRNFDCALSLNINEENVGVDKNQFEEKIIEQLREIGYEL